MAAAGWEGQPGTASRSLSHWVHSVRVRQPTDIMSNHHIIEAARRYIEAMPPSIEGQGGSTALFNVAVVLRRGFLLPEAIAQEILSAWNQVHSLPPWSEADLAWKIKSANQSTRPDGYLLNGRREAILTPTSSVLSRPQSGAVKRPNWGLRPMTDANMERVAKLRKVSVDAVHLVRHAGFLMQAHAMDDNGEHECWVVRDGSMFATARRLDGQPFQIDGRSRKGKHFPGSIGRGFVGTNQKWLGGESCPVLVLEGCPALIEGVAAALLVGGDLKGWTILSAISAGSRFAADPQLLRRISDRRIRICPDHGLAGQNAGRKWAGELHEAGCKIDFVTLPHGCSDLGELLAMPPEIHLPELTAIFTL